MARPGKAQHHGGLQANRLREKHHAPLAQITTGGAAALAIRCAGRTLPAHPWARRRAPEVVKATRATAAPTQFFVRRIEQSSGVRAPRPLQEHSAVWRRAAALLSWS